jgi:hypothetical protein
MGAMSGCRIGLVRRRAFAAKRGLRFEGSRLRHCGRGLWRVPRQDAGFGRAADAIQRGNPILCLRTRRKTRFLNWSRSSAG